MGLNLVQPLWFSPFGIGDLSQFVYLVQPLWFSASGIGDLSQKPKGLNKIDKFAKVGYN
jgi:hypothetical protein